MINENNASEKSAKKVPRYVIVARQLFRTKDYTASKILAESTNMEPIKFRASVPKAKELMATHGFMVTNKTMKTKENDKTGYKRATFEEFKAEIHKSCTRASSHLLQALKLCSLLEKSEAVDGDLVGLKELLMENFRSMSFPNVERQFAEYNSLKPYFIDEMANEEIEDPEA